MFAMHPPLSALPFAFILLLSCLEVVNYWSPGDWVRKARIFLLLAVVVGTSLSFFSGYQASYLAGDISEAASAVLSQHHLIGRLLLFTVITMGIIYAIGTFARRGKIMFSLSYYMLLLLSLLLVVAAGFLGGGLVFEHGIGVKVTHE